MPPPPNEPEETPPVDDADAERTAGLNEGETQVPQATPPPGIETTEDEQVDDAVELVYGMRLHLAFGTSTGWHGGMCGGMCQKSGHIVIGFDDGDLREFEYSDLSEQMRNGACKIIEPEAGGDGLVDGERHAVGKAEGFTYWQETKKFRRYAGVLVGRSDDQLLQEPLFAEHYVCAAVFPQQDEGADAAATRGARRKRVSSAVGPTQQDRLGFHTFRRGDVVTYNNVQEGESAEAWVYAYMYKPAANGAQGRKSLVLFEPESSVFFAQNTPAWSRVCNDGREGFDCDDDTRATVISPDKFDRMMQVSSYLPTMHAHA